MPEAYATLPLSVLASPALSLQAKAVLMVLLNYKRIGGAIHPKIETLMADTALSRATLFRALAELKRLGIIGSERGRRFNTYVVVKHLSTVVKKLSTETCDVSSRDFTGSQFETSQPPYLLIEKKKLKRSNNRTKRKASSTVANRRPANAAADEPNTSAAERKPPASAQVIDWWPHDAAKVEAVRTALNILANTIRWPHPDDGIVRGVLDAANGAPTNVIERTLRQLCVDRRFDQMRSWGLVPVVIRSCF